MAAEAVLLAVVWGVAGLCLIALAGLWISINHSKRLIDEYTQARPPAEAADDQEAQQPVIKKEAWTAPGWGEEEDHETDQFAQGPWLSPAVPAPHDEPSVLERKYSVRQFASAIDASDPDKAAAAASAAKREERLRQELAEQEAERQRQREQEQREQEQRVAVERARQQQEAEEAAKRAAQEETAKRAAQEEAERKQREQEERQGREAAAAAAAAEKAKEAADAEAAAASAAAAATLTQSDEAQEPDPEVALQVREQADQLKALMERKRKRREAALRKRQEEEQAAVQGALRQLQSAEEALRAAESSSSEEVRRLSDQVARLKALVDLAMRKEDECRKALEEAIKAHGDAQHANDTAMAELLAQEEQLHIEAEALAEEESIVSQQHAERQQKLVALRAEEEERARAAAAKEKERVERKLRRQQEELRAQRTNILAENCVREGDKQLHLKSAAANEIVLSYESWYQPSWNKNEAIEYLQDTEKGAFIMRQSKQDFAVSLQCGPTVGNRVAHVRLQKWRRNDGTIFYNVAPTEHYFEHLYDLVLFCHTRPFIFHSIDPNNTIVLSLNAVQRAEEQKQQELDAAAARLEASKRAELERIEREERDRLLELEKQHQEIEERSKQALERRKRAMASVRRKHSSKLQEGQRRRRSSEQLVSATATEIAMRESELELAIENRKQLEAELAAAEQALRDALARKSEAEREAELLAERKRKAMQNKDEGVKVTVTETALEVNDVINFGPNNSVINKNSYPLLDAVAEAIKAHGEILIEVAGHTAGGGRNPARNVAYRKALSKDRANSVATYLKGQGVRAELLVTAGYGDTRPIATNETQDGRDLNRRVEFVVHKI